MSLVNANMSDKNQKHKKAMQKQKQKVDAHIEEASIEKGVVILLTGNGKGKSSSAFGMVLRAMGYGCLLYTSPSPRDLSTYRMPSSA